MDFRDEGIEAAVYTFITLVARSQVLHRCVYGTYLFMQYPTGNVLAYCASMCFYASCCLLLRTVVRLYSAALYFAVILLMRSNSL